jgi:hypothetical protein
VHGCEFIRVPGLCLPDDETSAIHESFTT